MAKTPNEVFRSKPFNVKSDTRLFKGRVDPLEKLFRITTQQNKQVVVSGQWGVGKTSLVNVFQSRFAASHQALFLRITCQSGDTLEKISSSVPKSSPPLQGAIRLDFAEPRRIADQLEQLAGNGHAFVVLDDLDYLPMPECELILNAMKLVQDSGADVRFILLCTVERREEIFSVTPPPSKHSAELTIPRMSTVDLEDILLNGFSELNLIVPAVPDYLITPANRFFRPHNPGKVDPDAPAWSVPAPIRTVALLAQGMPGVVHEIGLNVATQEDLQGNKMRLYETPFLNALDTYLEDHHGRVERLRSLAAWPELGLVLTAAALVTPDADGWLDLSGILKRLDLLGGIAGDVESFLSELDSREVLQNTPSRYRFRDPREQVLQLMIAHRLQGLTLEKLEASHEPSIQPILDEMSRCVFFALSISTEKPEAYHERARRLGLLIERAPTRADAAMNARVASIFGEFDTSRNQWANKTAD